VIRALAAWLVLSLAATAQTVPEPDDYKMEHYRGPVPSTLTGGTVVGPEAAHALWIAKRAGFIDVLPQPPKPANLPEGTIWRERKRHSIPGAIWLPNVGYGKIADVTAAYFRNGLSSVTNGDADHPVVFFCLEDCWMSWNAARRAIEWGYTSVYWFPEGTDAWALWEYPTEVIKPAEGQPQTQ